MKYFVDILKQFTPAQRLIVLVLLLSFTTGGVLTSQYLKTDDCRPIIEENLKMQDDFVKIAELLRKERLRDNMIQVDSVMIAPVDKEPIQVGPTMMDQILEIAESHKK
jgi:hypothetical protein